ncbi:hypothetical protein VaNZ11_007903, partial [Volvox africanus]
TGDVLFDETGPLMSHEYRLSTFKAIHSAAQLNATPGTPEQEASISMQVFLDLPAGTQAFYELHNTQTYRDRVWMTDRWTWCLGSPYWESGYMQSDYYSQPVRNISMSFSLSYLRCLRLGACTNSTFILLFQIRPPTGGDYYVGWDTGGCNQDGSDSLWPLVRLVVWHCPCPPPPEQPPPVQPALSPPPLPLSPPPPVQPALSPPPLPSSPPPPVQPALSPPPLPLSPPPRTPPLPRTLPPSPASPSPEPPKPTKAPRIPRAPPTPKPPPQPIRPEKPTRLARPPRRHRPPASNSPPPL